MQAPKLTLLTLAIFLLGSAAVQAQSFKYSKVRKDYVFDDGFGIPQSKTIQKEGHVKIAADEVLIDGSTYRRNEEGIFKNAKGKSVDLSFSYNGENLVAVRISTGHIINNYMVEPAPLESVVVSR